MIIDKARGSYELFHNFIEILRVLRLTRLTFLFVSLNEDVFVSSMCPML